MCQELQTNCMPECNAKSIQWSSKYFYTRPLHIKQEYNTTPDGSNKGNWGCIQPPKIIKLITEEIQESKRNLYTVWLDYQKANDSAPHSWTLHALKLAKVPEAAVTAIISLLKTRSTQVYLYTK